ncbi:hypothetical protein [Streptomyces tubercidicus]|uniref:hypothetical protein n=1 Tax=Streptomyces tubercidicus TaxID=47759 RepID=UPI003373151D
MQTAPDAHAHARAPDDTARHPHSVLYDPHGLIEAELPLDRTPYEALVTAWLAWKKLDLMGELTRAVQIRSARRGLRVSG